jgi:toxin-antitoxin system PIN domain toxin
MFLMDVNVLVYAHREDAANHSAYRQWLESVINSRGSFGYSELVLSGFLRVVTHPKVFEMPSTLSSAIQFARQIRSLPNAVCLAPGSMHWDIFMECLDRTNATGNDIADASVHDKNQTL